MIRFQRGLREAGYIRTGCQTQSPAVCVMLMHAPCVFQNNSLKTCEKHKIKTVATVLEILFRVCSSPESIFSVPRQMNPV